MSFLIPFSFWLLVCLNWSAWIEIGMKLNGGMTIKWVHFQKSEFLSSSKKTFHSSLFHHFWSFKNWTEWNLQCKSYHSRLFKSFLLLLSSLISLNWSKNDWMRVEWGIFLKQGKTLNSQISSILLSFQHSELILANK